MIPDFRENYAAVATSSPAADAVVVHAWLRGISQVVGNGARQGGPMMLERGGDKWDRN